MSEITFTTDVDITRWMPGKSDEKIKLVLPSEMPTGEYDIEVGIFDEEHPMVYLCTDAQRNGGYYKAGKININ